MSEKGRRGGIAGPRRRSVLRTTKTIACRVAWAVQLRRTRGREDREVGKVGIGIMKRGGREMTVMRWSRDRG